MDRIAVIKMLMMSDPLRLQALEKVAALELPDSWIGAGFVRDAVWDHLHDLEVTAPSGDVDVVWFGHGTSQVEVDRRLERRLYDAMPTLRWSVKNQARMHVRNGDAPYASVSDAMRHWPETATAVAVRLEHTGSISLNAPFGLNDLFALQLAPTPSFRLEKLPTFRNRVGSKGWMSRYPRLSLQLSALDT